MTMLRKGEMWRGANEYAYERDPVAQVLVSGHGAFSPAEIGAMLGVSRQRVQKIQAQALGKIRRALLDWEQGLEDAARHDAPDVMQTERDLDVPPCEWECSTGVLRAEVADLLAERARLGELLAAARSQFFGQYDED